LANKLGKAVRHTLAQATAQAKDDGAELTDGLLAICVSSIKAKSAGGLVPDEVTEISARLHEALISKLIEMEVPINWIGDGQTALMRSVSDGGPSTVELLFQLGANVNSTGGNDTTPLMCVVYSRKGQCRRKGGWGPSRGQRRDQTLRSRHARAMILIR
jgi:hypothetical protein